MMDRTHLRMPIPRSNRKTSLALALLAALFAAALAIPQEISAPASATYTVRSGDTLAEIARDHGTTAERLQTLNGLRDARQLKVGQTLRVPVPYRTYTVRAGDTVAEIAKKFGLSADSIVRQNNLKDPNDIAVGQDLRIPNHASAATPTAPAPVSASRPSMSATPPATPVAGTLAAELARIRIAVTKWKYIVVHHSASAKGSAAGMDAYHRNDRHMENGLAYHFVIGNGLGMRDGEVAIGNRWRRQIKGGHLASPALNEVSIGICLVGDFEKARPTAAQLRSLRSLMTWLMNQTRVQKANIKTHTQINTRPTACPGRNFPTRDMANWQYPRP
jgi:LysM repeat protein